MARKNRVVVPDGTYHVTSRIAGRARLLADPETKDTIVEWLHAIAMFSGVELLAWCIMDNHFHLLVHVPEVPAEYRLDPSEEPDAYAFGMRPADRNPPIWPNRGDCPHDGGGQRPPTGFTLPDGEMADRLAALYGQKRADAFRRRWEEMRGKGLDTIVEAEKEPFLRRMYSLTPFVKTFKERIAYLVNRRLGRTGHVFEGRYYSGLVEEGRAAMLASMYADYNPAKAGMVDDVASYRWCSFSAAHGGTYAKSCREGYARTFGRTWPEAREYMRQAFAERLPEGVGKRLRKGETRLTVSQIIHLRVPEISRGAYLARSVRFAKDALSRVARGFPAAGAGSLARLIAMVDWDAGISAA